MKSFRKNGKEKPIIIGDNIKRKRHGFFRFLKNFKFPDLSDNPKVQFMNKFSLLFHGLLPASWSLQLNVYPDIPLHQQ